MTIPKTVIVVSTLLTAFTVLYFTVGPGLLTNIFGFAYPAFASFKAIESPEKEDDTQWLTYWVVFSLFSLMETFSDQLSDYFPMYYAMKLAFLFWLSGWRGAEFIYNNGLRQILADNEVEIDRKLNEAERAAKEIGGATREVANKELGDMYNEAKAMIDEASKDQ